MPAPTHIDTQEKNQNWKSNLLVSCFPCLRDIFQDLTEPRGTAGIMETLGWEVPKYGKGRSDFYILNIALPKEYLEFLR